MSVTFFIALGILTAGDIAMRMKAEPMTVAEFYEAYKRYGLWLPPKDAKLVRWEENKVASGGSGLWLEKKIHLQLLLRERTPQTPAKVWENGIEYFEHRSSRLNLVRPTPDQLEGVDFVLAERWLAFAAQAYELGWMDLAKAAFERGRSEAGSRQYPWDVKNNPCHSLFIVRRQAWEECYYQLLEPDTDRLRIYQRMKRVSDDDSVFRTEYHRDFLADLDRTICSRQLRRIGTAGLIDELTEIVSDPTRYYCEPNEQLTPFELLCRKGFDAVPEAIRSINDSRLTRAGVLQGINNGIWVDTARVGTAVRAWLVNLSDGDIDGKEEDNERFRQSAEKWFKDASKIGEVQWAWQRANNDNGRNAVLLHLLAAKDPEKLAKLFRKQLHPSGGNLNGQIVGALAHADLPREKIIELFTEAAMHDSIGIRESGLDGLRIVAPNRMPEFLLRHVMKLNECREIANHTEYSDTRLRRWLIEFGDSPAWAEYAKLLHRLSPQRRIVNLEFVGRELKYPFTDKNRSIVAFLRNSWDDTSIRTRNAQSISLSFAYQYPQIAVGDFVSLTIADYLDIDIPWNINRSPSEWAALRKMVERKLEDVLAR